MSSDSYFLDSDDLPKVLRHKWHMRGNYLATFTKGELIFLHKLILGAGKGQQVDHINGNKLDNRKSNLRFCTPSENMMNKGKTKRSKSQYKCVHFFARRGKFQAYITKDKKKIHLGYFDTEEEAAKAYDEYAKILFGKFAKLNFGDSNVL